MGISKLWIFGLCGWNFTKYDLVLAVEVLNVPAKSEDDQATRSNAKPQTDARTNFFLGPPCST